MRTQLAMMAVFIGLAGCSSNDVNSTELSESKTTVEAAQTVAPIIDVAAQPPAPAPVGWQAQYTPGAPYFNQSEAIAIVFADPHPKSQVIGEIAPGASGLVIDCNDDATWCELAHGEDGAAGWVDMSMFAERQEEASD